MMEIYVIGFGAGNGMFAIGLAKSAKDRLDELQRDATAPRRPKAEAAKLKLLRTRKLSRGWEGLAEGILQRQLARWPESNGWYPMHSTVAYIAVERAFEATQPNGTHGPDYAATMRHIREQVLSCSQEVFAAIAGTSHATVSRWESGELVPGIEEIRRIREFCIDNSMAWDDERPGVQLPPQSFFD
jgi:DNA-binding XRE family transcriptional regulator